MIWLLKAPEWKREVALTTIDMTGGLQDLVNYNMSVNERISNKISKNVGGPARFSLSSNMTDSTVIRVSPKEPRNH